MTSNPAGEAGLALLRAKLANLPAVIWDCAGISAAAATGNPVHIVERAGGQRPPG